MVKSRILPYHVEEMRQLFRQGSSFRAIARQLSIDESTVRGRLKPSLTENDYERNRTAKLNLTGIIEAHKMYRYGYTYAQINARLFIGKDTLTRRLTPMLTPEDIESHRRNYRGKRRGRKRKRGPKYVYRCADKLAALKKAATYYEGEILSRDMYIQWAKSHPGHPTAATFVGMSWSEWLNKAGLPTKKQRYTDKEVLTALRDAYQFYGPNFSTGTYDKWHRNNAETPSRSALRKRKPWNQWLDTAGIPQHPSQRNKP